MARSKKRISSGSDTKKCKSAKIQCTSNEGLIRILDIL